MILSTRVLSVRIIGRWFTQSRTELPMTFHGVSPATSQSIASQNPQVPDVRLWRTQSFHLSVVPFIVGRLRPRLDPIILQVVGNLRGRQSVSAQCFITHFVPHKACPVLTTIRGGPCQLLRVMMVSSETCRFACWSSDRPQSPVLVRAPKMRRVEFADAICQLEHMRQQMNPSACASSLGSSTVQAGGECGTSPAHAW